MKKVTKNNFRFLKKAHAHLQTMPKTPVKFQKDPPKTLGGVALTRYILFIGGRNLGISEFRNFGIPEYRKAENHVPSLFFEKAGDNK